MKKIHDYESPLLKGMNRLLRQLSRKRRVADLVTLSNLVDGGGDVTLAIAGRLIGMGTLIPVRSITGISGFIEDVVVDREFRGRGVGKHIMECLITSARGQGMKHIDLTSRLERKGAQDLYRRLGFERRDTNAFRLKL